MLIYHGSGMVVQYPEIRVDRFTKDFSWGFYCTNNIQQATRWAKRHRSTKETPFVNFYEYIPNVSLNIKKFLEMTEEWLDFIVSCRSGKSHPYDIVEGPMADDQIWTYIEDFISTKITRTAFWELAKFQKPTHQISFHTINALLCLKFVQAKEV